MDYDEALPRRRVPRGQRARLGRQNDRVAVARAPVSSRRARRLGSAVSGRVRRVPLAVVQIGFVLATIGLGAWGWTLYFSRSRGVNGFDITWDTLDMFLGNLPTANTGTLPWQAQAARFLALFSGFLIALGAAVALFGPSFQRLMLAARLRRRAARAAFVCGRGRWAAQAALHEAARYLAGDEAAHWPVLLVAPETTEDPRRLREAGVIWVPADATHGPSLARLGGGRAQAIVALDDDKHWNARVVLAAEDAADAHRSVTTRIAARLSSDILVPERHSERGGSARTAVDVDVLLARHILSELDPFAALRFGQPLRGRRLVIVADDDVGEALLIEAARLWVTSRDLGDGGVVSVDGLALALVGTDAERRVERLRINEPSFDDWAVELVGYPTPSTDMTRDRSWQASLKEQPLVLFAALENPLGAFAVAQSIAGIADVKVATVEDGDGSTWGMPARAVIDVSGGLGRIETYLEAGEAERLAQAAHRRWVNAERRTTDATGDAAQHLAPWRELSLSQQLEWTDCAQSLVDEMRAAGGIRDATLEDLRDAPRLALRTAAKRALTQHLPHALVARLPDDAGPAFVAGCLDAGIALADGSWQRHVELARAATSDRLTISELAAAVIAAGRDTGAVTAELSGELRRPLSDAVEVLRGHRRPARLGERWAGVQDGLSAPGPGRLLYLAGGAASMSEIDSDRLVDLLDEALRPLHSPGLSLAPDAILCGGTDSGMSGAAIRLAERLHQRGEAVPAHGWLPEEVAAAPGVIAHRTPGQRVFSVLDPLQMWKDLRSLDADDRLTQGLVLVAAPGGAITGAEIDFAAAMGIPIAFLTLRPGLQPAHLEASRGQLALPPDPMILRAFLLRSWALMAGGGGPQDPATERLARRIHDAYRSTLARRRSSLDPAMQAWDSLDPRLADSNREQARALRHYCRELGDPGEELATLLARRETLETLARLEHGRWTIERLLTGWRPGPRDVAQLTHPNLVPWNELSEAIQQLDRDAITAMGHLLRPDGARAAQRPPADR